MRALADWLWFWGWIVVPYGVWFAVMVVAIVRMIRGKPRGGAKGR